MFERVRGAIEAGRAAVAEAEGGPAEREKPALALLVLDEPGPDADRLTQRHIAAAEKAGRRALFVLGPASQGDLGRLDLTCEFLPLAEEIGLSLKEHPDVVADYLIARLSAMFVKWQVSECLWTGLRAGELVERWRTADMPGPKSVEFREIELGDEKK